jgi:hypothetical protein
MAVLKLHLEEFDEVDYSLIAIHSLLEDFRLAFFINQKLPIILSRNKETLAVAVKEGEAFFSIYTYENEKTNSKWSLMQNKNEVKIMQKNSPQSLFLDTSLETSRKVYLISEHKKVDYFLKIENNFADIKLEQIVDQLKKIERISAVYALIPEKIKSKNNLIF